MGGERKADRDFITSPAGPPSRERLLSHCPPGRKRAVIKKVSRPVRRRVVKRAPRISRLTSREPLVPALSPKVRASPSSRGSNGVTEASSVPAGHAEKVLDVAPNKVPGERGEISGSGGKSKEGSGGIIPPLPLVNKKPPYPPLARRKGYEGRLVVRLLVSPSGEVGRVVLLKSSGYYILDRVAVKTLRGWKFRPAMKDGRPISYWVEVPVVFDLKEARG